MYDLIVIGGGPAGLTAAIYAIRKRLNVLMVSKDLGGKTQWQLALPWIEDYQVIRGLEMVNKFKSELEYLDFARHMEAVEKVEREGDHFIVPHGGRRRAGDQGGDRGDGHQAAAHECAGRERIHDEGAVLFGAVATRRCSSTAPRWWSAMRSWRCARRPSLSTIAKKVYAGVPGGEAAGHRAGQEAASGCQCDHPAETPGGGSEGRRVRPQRGAQGRAGRRPRSWPRTRSSSRWRWCRNSQMVADLVELDAEGRIKVDCGNRTNVPGIFAAGDVASGYAEQVLIAVGEGAKAALSAYDYLLSK